MYLILASKGPGPAIMVLLMIFMPILVTIMAHKKGRLPVVWFLYSLVLWPVAFLHILALSPQREFIVERDVRLGKIKECPHCAESINPRAKVCKHCQRDL